MASLKSSAKLLTVLFLLFAAVSVEALKCYSCLGVVCQNPRVKECPADKTHFCIAADGLKKGHHDKIRDCIPIDHVKDACSLLVDDRGKCRFCTEDLCNK